VAEFEPWVCSGTLRALIDVAAGNRTPNRDCARTGGLSTREAEVLRLAALGAGEERIATTMRVSRNTVKTYVRRIREKLQVRTRAAAVEVARERGVLTGPVGLDGESSNRPVTPESRAGPLERASAVDSDWGHSAEREKGAGWKRSAEAFPTLSTQTNPRKSSES